MNSPGVLYATKTFSGGDVRKYSGGTWQTLPHPLAGEVTALAVSPGNSNSLLAASTIGVFRTNTGGVSAWTRSDNGLIGGTLHGLTTGAGKVYAGTETGELAAGNADSTLTRSEIVSGVSTDPVNLLVLSAAGHPTDANIVLAGMQGTGLKISTNAGSTWTSGPAGLAAASVDVITFDGTHPEFAYATARSISGAPLAPLWRSTDGGLTFGAVASNLGAIRATRIAVDPKNSSRLFLSSGTYGSGVDGIFRSDDSGVTWAKLSADSAFDIAVDPENPTRVYAAAGWLKISDDTGATFTTAPGYAGSTYGNVTRIVIDPHSSNVVYLLTAACVSGPCEFFVLRSVDRGASFEVIPHSALSTWAPLELTINPAHPTTVLVGSPSRGLHAFDIATDLSVSIEGHSATRPAGLPSSFDVSAKNVGPFAATSVVYTATLPAGSQNVSATMPGPAACSRFGDTMTCVLPSLKVNDVASMRVTYTPPAVNTVAVQAAVVAREGDLVFANNTASASAAIGEVVDLVVTEVRRRARWIEARRSRIRSR